MNVFLSPISDAIVLELVWESWESLQATKHARDPNFKISRRNFIYLCCCCFFLLLFLIDCCFFFFIFFAALSIFFLRFFKVSTIALFDFPSLFFISSVLYTFIHIFICELSNCLFRFSNFGISRKTEINAALSTLS